MSDLQGEASETEQPTSESKEHSNKTDFWANLSTIAFFAYVGWEMYRVVNRDDMLKAAILFYTQKLLKELALVIGTAALLCEKEYNDYMATLH